MDQAEARVGSIKLSDWIRLDDQDVINLDTGFDLDADFNLDTGLRFGTTRTADRTSIGEGTATRTGQGKLALICDDGRNTDTGGLQTC